MDAEPVTQPRWARRAETPRPSAESSPVGRAEPGGAEGAPAGAARALLAHFRRSEREGGPGGAGNSATTVHRLLLGTSD